jgi:uncharacterized membrane protein YfcA
MGPVEVTLLVLGGFVAGIANTLAGGASLLTVPLLVLVGLPGTVANGTNRFGVCVQNVVASWRFRAEGVSGFRDAVPVLLPIAAGSAIGATAISQVSDSTFERLFGIVMVLLLLPMLRPGGSATGSTRPRWSAPARALVFFLIGLYGGAFQAGVGIALVMALSYAGFDLVRANSIKVVVNALLTAVALPVFALQGQVMWLPGAILAVGFVGGGLVGVRLAVRGGERIIRPVLAVCVLGLAGRMLGLY